MPGRSTTEEPGSLHESVIPDSRYASMMGKLAVMSIFRYARMMPTSGTITHDNDDDIDDVVTAVSEDAEDEEDNSLVSLMESLAIQTAVSALAEANDMADVERAIDEQATRIHTQARCILQCRSNGG